MLLASGISPPLINGVSPFLTKDKSPFLTNPLFRPLPRYISPYLDPCVDAELQKILGDDDELKGIYKRLVADRLASDSECVLDIKTTILIAGLFRKTKFIKFIDKKIPKTGRTYKIVLSVGQLLAAFLLVISTGQYQSIASIQSTLKTLPIHTLLGLPSKVTVEDFSYDALSRALDKVFDYGTDKLFRKYYKHVAKCFGIAPPKEVHIDSTNFYTYHMTSLLRVLNEDLNKGEEATGAKTKEINKRRTVCMTYGHSKDGKFGCNLVGLCSLCDGFTGIPLLMRAIDGNASDKVEFASILEKDLPEIIKQCPGLKLVVGDSALCTQVSFINARNLGVHIVTRMPDNFAITKNLLDTIDPTSLPLLYDETEWQQEHGSKSKVPRGKLIPNREKWGIPLLCLFVFDPNTLDNNLDNLENKATQEKEKIEKALSTNSFACRKDANTFYNNQKEKVKYCLLGDVDLVAAEEDKEGNKIKVIKAQTTVTINQQFLKNRALRDSCYLVVTSDVKHDWTGAELLECYKRNSSVENSWRLSKNSRLCLKRFFLKKESRIESLLCLMYMNVLNHTLISHLLRKGVEEGKLTIPYSERRIGRTKPTVEAIFNYFSTNGPYLKYKWNHKSFKPTVLNVNEWVVKVCFYLGKEWAKLLLSRTYALPDFTVKRIFELQRSG